MKNIFLLLFLFISINTFTQRLYSIWVSPVDSSMYVINPLTNDTIQVTKLPKTVYSGVGSGTAYGVTSTPALVHLGTSDPTVTFIKGGTYLVMWNVRTDYALATIAISRQLIYKVRRINNTPTDINVSGFSTPVLTLLSFSGPDISRQFVYTATAGDILQIWASVNTIPTAGAITVPEAQIIALRLY